VIIVGAGPSGLLLGILLAKSGVKVQLVEAAEDLDKNPRAAHYAPSAVYELNRAGVLEDVKAKGIHPDAVCWRNPDGSFIAGIKSRFDIEFPMVCLPLDQLDELLLEHYLRQPNAEILWRHKVLSIDQDEKEARVHVETPEGKLTLGADYVVGCDGANSQIRRSLFGDLNYPGETLQAQIIATNVGWPSPFNTPQALTRSRYTTTSRNLVTGTQISFSTRTIGIWLPESPTMVFGELLMAMFRDCRTRSISSVSQKGLRRSYLGARSQAIISLQAPAHINFTRDAPNLSE
jgi:2-polyprenyl-6-methoxyphenol hydroxylase-like FAD-dependent oxidoreductase